MKPAYCSRGGAITIVNYMANAHTEAELHAAQALCQGTEPDATGLTNQQKWTEIMNVFQVPQATLFTTISYESIYASDVPASCRAASYFADLRVQYLRTVIAREPENWGAHQHYVANLAWKAKLARRAELDDHIAQHRADLLL
jgi:hypothetical protein